MVLPLALLALVLPLARVVELSEANFDRLVLGSSVPAFVKFYAPWCPHCKQMAPAWQQVEKMFSSGSMSTRLLVGSVDCSNDPEKPSSLCARFQTASLPSLKFFFRPRLGKATTYDGNHSAEALLDFATEISSTCSLSEQHECTEAQRSWLAEYDQLPTSELARRVAEASAKSAMARMGVMMMHCLQCRGS